MVLWGRPDSQIKAGLSAMVSALTTTMTAMATTTSHHGQDGFTDLNLHSELTTEGPAELEPRESWFNRTFPFLRWSSVSPNKLQEIEEQILNRVKTRRHGFYVDIGTINGQPCRIWTHKFGDHDLDHRKKGDDSPARTPLVMMHGMGAGLAMFAFNILDLAADRPVYAIDLPGFARSSRPHFSSDHKEAEKQYVIAIEEWRKKVGLEQMCLLGHSFGGYLATSYALTYPDHLNHVVLADPWGFPEKPTDIARRFNPPWWFKAVYSVAKHFNPLSTLRMTGPYGLNTIKRMRPELIAKFQEIFETEEECMDVIPKYLLYCNSNSPTGESAFTSLMTGFAWAKEPMLQRVPGLSPKVPLTVIYGGDSWVDAVSQETFESLRQGDEKSYTKVEVIPGAGHHVYADQYREFNKQVIEACRYTMQ